ncbi:glycosyltransferase family 9 protein [Ramlibacter sp. PS4R-6]|uniref:glycosyltransferase family 9 protein n=1 Tax=Ramlibacter sp. PS4R-6 TaxID=3133438 RepID=UPI0030974326
MRSVLVVVTRQIGDVLLTTPLIHAAKQLWPEAAVDVLGFQGTLGMLRGNAEVREIIETPPRLGFGGTLALAHRLWKRYDLALVADVGDRAHIIGAIAGRVRSGVLPADNPSNWWKKRLLAHAVEAAGDLGEVHVVQEKLALLEPWRNGMRFEAKLVPPPGKPLPPELAGRLQPRYVVVHAPSMWPYKQWPPAHFAALVRRLLEAGRQVVLTGGPSKEDRELVASLATGGAIDAGVLDFGQLASLLQGAALYVGPDTSISHLAAACGTPMVAIFGPTNPQRWAPWPAQTESPVRFVRRADAQTVGSVTLLQADLPCVPCGKAGCDDHRFSRTECLPAITPERVANEALRILAAA